MSIKRLFIVTLVLLFACIAAVQTGLTYYFKHQIETELYNKSQALSEKVLANTKDRVHKQLFQLAPLNEKSNKTMRYEFHIDAKNEADTDLDKKQTKVVERQVVIDSNNNANVEISHHTTDELKAVFLAVENLDNMELHQSITTEVLTDNSNFERFTQLIIWSIFISCAVAMLLALWLTNKLTQPINQLINAMDQLDQNKLGIQITPTGVTELKKCGQQFNTMSAKLENYAQQQSLVEQKKHLAELGELSRGIAHALRNPVHTLSLTLDQYFKSSKNERNKLEQVALTKIEHIDKNINALLSLAKDQVDRDQRVPVNAVLQDIKLELLHESCPIEINCDANIEVAGLETEIRSIVHTLIVNGVEAGVEDNLVTVNVTQSDEQLTIDVYDQGKGVSDSIKPYLFNPHVSDKSDGAGIGLYLAKQIVHLYYCGDIQLIQSDNTGSHFRVTFKRGL